MSEIWTKEKYLAETQPTLAGISRANHSNLGKQFEAEIVASNNFYRLKGLVDVVQNNNAFDFAAGSYWHKYKTLFEQKDNRAAQTGDGRILMRVYSDVDFSGGNGSQSFAFDCKEARGRSLPLASVKSHQISRLVQSAKCGVTSGILVKLTELDRVFFLPAEFLARKEETRIKSLVGRRRAENGTASISDGEMQTEGKEVFRNKVSGLWNWLEVLSVK